MESRLQERISIVIPVYNEGAHIRESMARVEQICREASIPYELVLIDDGSREDRKSVV